MNRRDICDRLQEIANLKAGDGVPAWLYDDPEWSAGCWATGMSKLLNEAIVEIKALRLTNKVMIAELKGED